MKKTFLNAHTCVTGVEACAPISYSSAEFKLDDEMIKSFYSKGRKHVHYITGLTTTEQPCNDKTSRWIRREGTCSGTYSGEGVEEIISALNIAAYFSAAKPTKYHELGDWKGQRAQCRAMGRDLCTYADYCPNGKGEPSAFDGKNSNEWLPILDTENEYVLIESGSRSCMKFTDAYGAVEHDHWGKLLYCCGNTGEEQQIKDVRLSKSCSAPAGSKVQVGNECWEHVHEEEWNVYDFTRWVRTHTDAAKFMDERKADPVAALAKSGQAAYSWPYSMADWKYAEKYWRNQIGERYLGRRGDIVDFVDLTETVQVEEMAQLVGAEGTRDVGFEACGSPGEVANVPVFGNQFLPQVGDGQRFQHLDSPIDTNMRIQGGNMRRSKQFVWYNIALKSNDQLRQRMAWALSQIFVIGEAGAGGTDETENYVTYYDIFVRHGKEAH